MSLKKIFKNILNESDWDAEYERLKKQELQDWCKHLRLNEWSVDVENGEWIINSSDRDIRIQDRKFLEVRDGSYHLPFKFGELAGETFTIKDFADYPISTDEFPTKVFGNFIVHNSLADFKNLPVTDGCLNLSHNAFPDWKVLPHSIGTLLIYKSKIKTFVGINYSLTFCNHIKFPLSAVNKGFLELLKLEYLEEITIMQESFLHTVLKRDKELMSIVNTHLKGDRDVFELQSDLIDAGFEEHV